jgi:hypothetical protein
MRSVVLLGLALAAAAAAVACGGDPVSRTLGARCDLSSECDERCLAPGTEYPGGFCTVSCDGTSDCPGGAACVDDGAGGGICLSRCLDDPDCAFLGTGWTCQELDQRPMGTVKICRGG